MMSFQTEAEVGATSGGVFNARMSEEQRNIQDHVDSIDREISLAQSNLTTKNNFISTMMSLTQQDFTTANDTYNTQLTKNIQIQNAVDTQADKIQTSARANLTTINNMVANSGKSWDNLDPTLKSQIGTLEMQAGFPPGTFEAFARSKPKANVVSTTVSYDSNNNQFISVVSTDPDTGVPSVTQLYTGGKKTSASTALDALLNGGGTTTVTPTGTPTTDTTTDTTSTDYGNLPPPVQ